MNKTKNSILNAISMFCNTFVISVLGLVSTNIIIKNYGSDVNGVVATASQIVNLLLILEGGFTLAVNVSLYKPYISNNYSLINKILSTAKNNFFKIGSIFFIVGTLVSLIYPFFIKSEMDYFTIFLIFFMVILSTTYNLVFTLRQQVLFQVSQKEYIYTLVSLFVNIFSNVTVIFLAYYKFNVLFLRFFVLFYILLYGFIVHLLFKKYFSYAKFTSFKDDNLIKGTKDLMVQKLTSVVYSSFPLIFISTFVSTKVSSIYAVYNSIYNVIRSGVNSVISAPINAFGQLISDNKFEKAYTRFILYEYIIILFLSILLSCTLCLIIPFVKLYTINVSEINYVNLTVAVMLAFSVFFELIHIPSGYIINVSGKFNVSKNINIIVSAILIFLLIFLGIKFDLYGILSAIIISNLILAFLEMWYVHCKTFNSNLKKIFIIILLNLFLIAMLLLFSFKFNLIFDNYFQFIKFGIIIFIFNSFIIFLVNYIFFHDMVSEFFKIIKNMFLKKLLNIKIK